MKVMEERTILPMLNAMFGMKGMGGGGGGNAVDPHETVADPMAGIGMFAGGGDIAQGGMAVVGDGGDGSGAELFAPKGPGTVLPHDVLEGIAKGGGGCGRGAPSVVINNVNNSSQAVDMKQGGVSYDAQARQFIIHTVLEDAASGGPVAGMLSGLASR